MDELFPNWNYYANQVSTQVVSLAQRAKNAGLRQQHDTSDLDSEANGATVRSASTSVAARNVSSYNNSSSPIHLKTPRISKDSIIPLDGLRLFKYQEIFMTGIGSKGKAGGTNNRSKLLLVTDTQLCELQPNILPSAGFFSGEVIQRTPTATVMNVYELRDLGKLKFKKGGGSGVLKIQFKSDGRVLCLLMADCEKCVALIKSKMASIGFPPNTSPDRVGNTQEYDKKIIKRMSVEECTLLTRKYIDSFNDTPSIDIISSIMNLQRETTEIFAETNDDHYLDIISTIKEFLKRSDVDSFLASNTAPRVEADSDFVNVHPTASSTLASLLETDSQMPHSKEQSESMGDAMSSPMPTSQGDKGNYASDFYSGLFVLDNLGPDNDTSSSSSSSSLNPSTMVTPMKKRTMQDYENEVTSLNKALADCSSNSNDSIDEISLYPHNPTDFTEEVDDLESELQSMLGNINSEFNAILSCHEDVEGEQDQSQDLNMRELEDLLRDHGIVGDAGDADEV